MRAVHVPEHELERAPVAGELELQDAFVFVRHEPLVVDRPAGGERFEREDAARAAQIQLFEPFVGRLEVHVRHGRFPVRVDARAVVGLPLAEAADAPVPVEQVELAARRAEPACEEPAPDHIRAACKVVNEDRVVGGGGFVFLQGKV
jgi:hypothetical protein